MNRRLQSFILGLIVLLSLALRLWNMGLSLPAIIEVDERIYTTIAAKMLLYGDLNPQWWNYPATNYLYLLAGIYACMSFLYYESVAHLFLSLIIDWSPLYLAGRVISIIIGTTVVYLIYLCARILYGGTAGILSAALAGNLWMLVYYSKQIRVDIFAAALALGCFYFSLRWRKSLSKRDLIISAAFAGQALCAKYPTGLIIPTFALVLFFAKIEEHGHNIGTRGYPKALVIFVLITVASFIISSPFFIFSLDEVMDSIKYELSPENLGVESLPPHGVLQWFWLRILPEIIGIPGFIILLLSIGLGLLSDSRNTLIVLSFPLFLTISYCMVDNRWRYWWLLGLPFLLMLIGGASSNMISKAKSNYLKALLCLIPAALSLSFLLQTIDELRKLSKPDTRVEAKAWIEEHIAPQSSLLMHPYTADLINCSDLDKLLIIPEVRRSLQALDGLNIDGLPCYFISKMMNDIERYNLYRRLVEGYDYVIVSSFIQLRHEEMGDARFISFYRQLEGLTEKIAVFKPSREIKGPTITIYKLPEHFRRLYFGD